MVAMASNSQYKLKVLSLGAGVQSSTLLLMACKGIIEKPNLAIFSDTGWESHATYMHLEWLKIEAGKHGIEVITCDNGNIRDKIIISAYGKKENKNGERWASMPCFVNNDGKVGMMRRECTYEHKITPIKKTTRKVLGLIPHQRAPKDCVEQWIGFSTDEAQRVFARKKDRMTFLRFPLLEMNMSRTDCQKWLYDNYQIIVPKSSCIGCPFHDSNEWKALPANEFKDACEFDKAIRYRVGMRGTSFLHRSCKPLEEVDFRSTQEIMEQEYGQQNWIKNEKLNLFVNNLSIAEI
jgi:hypothetical protein